MESVLYDKVNTIHTVTHYLHVIFSSHLHSHFLRCLLTWGFQNKNLSILKFMSQQLWVSPKSFPFKVLVLQTTMPLFKPIRKISKREYYLRHVCLFLRPPVRSSVVSEWKNLTPTGWIYVKFGISGFFEKSFEKIKFSLKFDKNKELCTWRRTYIRDKISVNFSSEWVIFLTVFQKNSKHTFCGQ